jgi:hypothetical protein
MTPDYSDKTRFSKMDLLLPIFAGWLLIQGVFGGEPLPILFALAGAAYLLYTRHKRYELFEDALVIRYFAPRTLVVYLADIQNVELLTQPMVGPVLVIQRKAGARLVIKPTNFDEFFSRLKAGLSE